MINNIMIFIIFVLAYLLFGLAWYALILIGIKVNPGKFDEDDCEDMMTKGKNVIPFLWPLCLMYTVYLAIKTFSKK